MEQLSASKLLMTRIRLPPRSALRTIVRGIFAMIKACARALGKIILGIVAIGKTAQRARAPRKARVRAMNCCATGAKGAPRRHATATSTGGMASVRSRASIRSPSSDHGR
jgi:hypothetical protein